MENITQQDMDNLADIIWWIKGYIQGVHSQGDDFESFKECHIESLRKVRSNWNMENRNCTTTTLQAAADTGVAE